MKCAQKSVVFTASTVYTKNTRFNLDISFDAAALVETFFMIAVHEKGRTKKGNNEKGKEKKRNGKEMERKLEWKRRKIERELDVENKMEW